MLGRLSLIMLIVCFLFVCVFAFLKNPSLHKTFLIFVLSYYRGLAKFICASHTIRKPGYIWNNWKVEWQINDFWPENVRRCDIQKQKLSSGRWFRFALLLASNMYQWNVWMISMTSKSNVHCSFNVLVLFNNQFTLETEVGTFSVWFILPIKETLICLSTFIHLSRFLNELKISFVFFRQKFLLKHFGVLKHTYLNTLDVRTTCLCSLISELNCVKYFWLLYLVIISLAS
jgi:hypothetical protein